MVSSKYWRILLVLMGLYGIIPLVAASHPLFMHGSFSQNHSLTLCVSLKGTDQLGCGANWTIPCQSLTYAFDIAGNQTELVSLRLEIDDGVYHFAGVQVYDVCNISLVSRNKYSKNDGLLTPRVNIVSTGGPLFLFVVYGRVELEGLVIKGGECVTKEESLAGGVTIVGAMQVIVKGCSIENNKGPLGGMGIYHTRMNESVVPDPLATAVWQDTFVDVEFWGNGPMDAIVDAENSGGGCSISWDNSYNMTFGIPLVDAIFQSLHFENNVGLEGGGLSMQFISGDGCSSTKGSNIHLMDSHFIRNQAQDAGGGLLILLDAIQSHSCDTAFDNMMVTVESCEFDENVVVAATSYMGFGGGIAVLFSGWGTTLIELNKVTILNSLFTNNAALEDGGALSIALIGLINGFTDFVNNTIVVDSCTFSGNAVSGVGGAVSAKWGTTEAIGNVVQLSKCQFFHCSADSGGAVGILLSSSELSAYNVGYGDAVYIVDSTVSDCQATTGGAVFLSGGSTLSIDKSILFNNDGMVMAGALYLEGTGDLMLSNTEFFNNTAPLASSLLTVARGHLNVMNVDWDVTGSNISNTIGVQVVDALSFTMDKQSILRCPRGSSSIVTNTLVHHSDSDMVQGGSRQFVTFKCEPCFPGTYSLDRGESRFPDTSLIQCDVCSHGAECHGGCNVSALPAYWGVQSDDSTLSFYACPGGYCECVASFDCCSGHRTGVLCGKCMEGYGETFDSPGTCRPSSDCGTPADIAAFVLLSVGISVIYVVYLILRPGKGYLGRSGQFKSVMYFFQNVGYVVAYIRRGVGVEDAINSWIYSMASVANMQPVFRHGLCPWYIDSATSLIGLHYLVPLVMWGFTVVAYIVIKYILVWRKKQQAKPGDEMEGISAPLVSDSINADPLKQVTWQPPPFAAASINLVLLMYTTLLHTTMRLLVCVRIDNGPGPGALRMYYNAEKLCFQSWVQYFAVLVVALILVPLPLTLYAWRRWVKYGLCGRRYRGSQTTSIRAVVRVLEGPYREGFRWWESVFMIRRLAIVSVYSFVHDPFLKTLTLAVVCFLAFASHVSIRPFRRYDTNVVESWGLGILMCLSVLNLRGGAYATAGVMETHSLVRETTVALEVVELVLLSPPLLFCVIKGTWTLVEESREMWRVWSGKQKWLQT